MVIPRIDRGHVSGLWRERLLCVPYQIRLFLWMLLFLGIFLIGPVMATENITLQPGPGLNDGTDDGSAEKGMDAGFTEAQPWGRNDGSSSDMRIFNSPCNIGVYPGFLQFSLADMPTQNIVKAEIQVMCWVYFNGAGWPWPVDPQLSLRKVNGSWNEMTVNWDNDPDIDSTIVHSHIIDTVGGYGSPYTEFLGWLSFDITELYKGWCDGSISNYGVAFMIENSFCTNGDILAVYTSDYQDPALRPKLVVTYEQAQETKAIPALASLGVVVLILLLTVSAFVVIRRRTKERA